MKKLVEAMRRHLRTARSAGYIPFGSQFDRTWLIKFEIGKRDLQ